MPVAQLEALPAQLTSRMAPEVFDMILDNLHQSKRDLSACSIVCKTWLPVCRYHLFAAVNYNAEFAHLLASSTHASLTIGPYIRTITFKGPLPRREENNLLIDRILSLPRVTSLQVEKIGWDTVRMESPVYFAPALSGSSTSHALLSLNLRQVNFSSFSKLAEFLGLFASLQNLTLENVTWDCVGCTSAGYRAGGDVTFVSSLKKLRVAFSNNRVVLNWLHHGIASDAILENGTEHRHLFPHLTSLSFPDILPGEVDILGAFLEALGDSLECLEAGILVQEFDGRNNDALSKSFGLSLNTSLKMIAIHQITLFQFPPLVTQEIIASHSFAQPHTTALPYAWLPNFISSIRSEEIQTIEFYIWLSSEPQLDQVPWTTLSNILVDIGVPMLIFHVSGTGTDMDLVKGWFMTRLAIIDLTKTVIKFDFSG